MLEGNTQKINYLGADGHQIKLINNPNSTDVSYQQVINFIQSDDTDMYPYLEGTFTCGDYAEKVHNNAEAAGIKAGWVAIAFKNDSINHACNAFNTTDRGLIFIDCTTSDAIITEMIEGKKYTPHPIIDDGSIYKTMGVIKRFKVYW